MITISPLYVLFGPAVPRCLVIAMTSTPAEFLYTSLPPQRVGIRSVWIADVLACTLVDRWYIYGTIVRWYMFESYHHPDIRCGITGINHTAGSPTVTHVFHSAGIAACSTTRALAELDTTIAEATSPIVFLTTSPLAPYSSKVAFSS